MVLWSSDTCQCKIKYEHDTGKHEKTFRKCNLHESLEKDILLKEAIKHNISFNTLHKDKEIEELNTLKIAERQRIRELSNEPETTQ